MVIKVLSSIYISEIIKVTLLLVFSNFIYLKIINHEKLKLEKTIYLVMTSVLSASVYMICIEFNLTLTAVVIANLLNGFILYLITNQKNIRFILTYLLSFIISYVLYGISLILSSLLIGLIGTSIDIENTFCFVLIVIIYTVLNVAFNKLKRFKNGFNFLKKIDATVTVIVLIFCGVVITIFSMLPKTVTYESQELIFMGAVFIIAALFIVIRNLITKHYKNNMRDRNIVIQKEEIDSNVKIIEELKEQNLKLSTTIHKYNHRLSALENSIRKLVSNSNVEFAKELSVVLEQTQNVTTQFAEETKIEIKLPITNVISVDNMMEFMRDEAVKCGIDFTFKLSDSIKPLLDKYISEDKFETLLADHIKDAIIAINAKAEGYKGIMILIGVSHGAYELSIYDTGIEFDISTLLKLGTEPITTHKDNGGSGLGFMTTFETLKSSKASLVIEEYDTRVTNYTKSVTIRFDNKCEYRIYSYRAEEIKKCCNGRNIIIKNI